MSFCALSAGQKALALMLPSATDLLGREHVLSHEVFDPLEDGLSFRRLPEQSVVSGHRHGPGETHITPHVTKSREAAGDQNSIRSSARARQTVASCACLDTILQNTEKQRKC